MRAYKHEWHLRETEAVIRAFVALNHYAPLVREVAYDLGVSERTTFTGLTRSGW